MQFPTSLVQILANYNLQPYPSFTGLQQPLTVHTVTRFLCALLWACVLLVSFTGWGRFAGKGLRIQSLPASVACSLGIATVIFLGGWINLLHGIYPAVLFALVGLGLLLYVALRQQRPEANRWRNLCSDTSRWTRVLIVITLLILVLRVAATVRLGEFRVEDDGSAYMVFPQKMLAAHHFAADPFSDRRVISSVGGAYLLQAFVITATSLAHIGMADRTFGLILMFFALLDLGVAFGLSPPQIAAMELIAYLVPQETFNLTFEILPISLLLSMIWIVFMTLEQAEHQRWRYAALMGAIGGATISLKSTFLPFVGAVALIPYLLLFWEKRRTEALKLPLVAGLGSLFVMVAWMIAMKHNSGTFLFPLLGHGFDYSSYGLFPSMPRFSSDRAVIRTLVQGIGLLSLAAIQYFTGIHDRRSRLSFGVLIAAALAITAFNYESGGDYIWRYNFTQFFTTIAIFFAAQAAVYNQVPYLRRNKMAYSLAALSFVSCIFYYDLEGGHLEPFRQMRTEIGLYRHNLRASLTEMSLVSPAIAAEYKAVGAAVPKGATALDISTDSFLLIDRHHKKFFLDDWPGAAAPPPGWPLTQGPEAAAQFLSHNSVRYAVYGYDYAHWFDMRSCQSLPHQTHFSELDHALEVLSFVTHHQFDQLRATHKTVYDDGKIAVIDLGSPVSPNSPVEPNWTLRTSEADMCAAIVGRYIASHPSEPVTQWPSS